MSYDIYLRHEDPTKGHPDLPGPTYNLTPIFDLALTGEEFPNPDTSEARVVLLGEKTDRPRGLRLLSGRKAKDTTAWLDKTLSHLRDPEKRTTFKALEPTNGWGTLDTAIIVIEWLLQASRDCPDHTWEVR
jgi:hypothetical protein